MLRADRSPRESAKAYATNAIDAPIMMRRPHVVEGESRSPPSDTRTTPNRTPKTSVSVANTVTYLMNLGKSRKTRSRRDGGGSSLVDGPRTMARNMADPIQPIAESMCNQARTALTKLETMDSEYLLGS